MDTSKPRIAIIGPVYPFRGGISHYTSHLANHLVNEGYPVSIFSFRRQYPSWLYPGETDRDPSLQPIQSDAQYILDPLYPWTWTECFQQLQQDKPDLVVFPWWTTFWGFAYGYLLKRLQKAGINTTVLIHNVLPHEAKPWDRWITRETLRQSNNFIVQSTEQGARLRSILPSARILKAPHPVYDQFPGKRMDSMTARDQLGLPNDCKILLFFGIVRPYKGLNHLIDAMAVLHDMGQNIHLLVVGEFWESLDHYRKQIQELNLTQKITIYPGYASNESLPIYFSAVDLLVAPYIGGTQSGAVKLALGFGTPVLVSRLLADDLLLKLEGKGVTITNLENPQIIAQDILKALGSSKKGLVQIDSTDSGWNELITNIIHFAHPVRR